MNVRGVILAVILGVPALGLLAFGPRGRAEIPADRVVVRYWEKWTGIEGEAIRRLVDQFNQTVGAEKRIWVEYCTVSNVDQRMLISTAGGDPPDVAGLFDHIVAQFADQNALLPLDELVAEHAIDLKAFKPIWLDLCRYQGRLFALPSTPYTVLLFYNRALFREAGLDPDRPPQTPAELSEFARRLTKFDPQSGKITQLGFTASPAMLGWWPWVWPMFFDARMWDGQRCRIDDDATLAAMEWLRAFRDAIGRDAVLQFEAAAGPIESAENPFLSGQLAMVFQGPWFANWARRYTPDLDYGVALFPSADPRRRHVFASLDLFVIPRGAKQPREAMVFLAYMMQPEVLDTLCRDHGKVSPFRQPSPVFFAGHPNPFVRVFDEAAASPDAFGYPQMPMWSQVRTESLWALNSILRGLYAPPAALLQAQANIDRIVVDYQRMAARRSPP